MPRNSELRHRTAISKYERVMLQIMCELSPALNSTLSTSEPFPEPQRDILNTPFPHRCFVCINSPGQKGKQANAVRASLVRSTGTRTHTLTHPTCLARWEVQRSACGGSGRVWRGGWFMALYLGPNRQSSRWYWEHSLHRSVCTMYRPVQW